MKISKNIETEVLKVYETWLNSYLNGDVETYNSFLDDDYHFIGSTNNEEFLSRKNTTKFFADTAEQLAGKCDLRSEKRVIEQFGELVFITHFFDAWFRNGTDYSYYGRFRFTNTLRKNAEGWRFVYQHFSTPDSKTDEGETIGFDKISEENKELREAIKRGTIELSHKNRELEIETAIERIRARSLAMQSSDELLETSDVMLAEINKLNIHAMRIGICTINAKTEAAEIWSRSETKKKVEDKILGVVPKGVSPVFDKMVKAWKQKKPFYTNTRKGKEVADYYIKVSKYLSYPLPAEYNTEETLSSFFFSEGALNVISLLPLESEENRIMLRFANVFGQVYRRFLDLQKAEAQAREAEIELALERLRARTMAMKHSDELQEASHLLDQQVRALGIETWGCAFSIYREKDSIEWFGNEKGVLPTYVVPREGIFKEYYEYGQEGKSIYVQEFVGEKCIAHYEYMSSLPVIGDVLRQLKEANGSYPEYQIDHVVYFKYGYLLFITVEQVPESHDIFKRFAKVFEQTYTRFLDLQKAEKQAREAEIDLALERVRSQAMAMQKSTDLLDIVVTMRKEFTRLGHEAHYFWHMMWLPEKYEKAMTSGDGTKIGFVMELPRHMHGDIPLLDRWEKSKEPTVVYAMDTDAAIDYIDKMVSLGDFKNIDPQAPTSDDIRHIGGLTFVMARTTHGEIGYSLPGIVENPAQADLDILVRFAGAFDIAHRRFLDLQKSEAQARGVEIELALEKVRSRSMGMQKSDELKEVIQVVYDQFVRLKINVEHTGFILDYKQRDDLHIWLADRHLAPSELTIPCFDSTPNNSIREARDNGRDSFIYLLTFEEKNKFYKELFKVIPDVPEETVKYYFNCPGLAGSGVLLENIGLYIENFDGIPYSDEDSKTLMRFGKVFQQAYTRFLDLQKAESQAKEAQIETALERVRSRSMAMHNSNEIGDVASVLFQQLKSLGGELWGTGFGFCQKNSDVDEYWFANENGIMPQLKVPNNVDPTHKQMYQGWNKNLELFSIAKDGKKLKEHYEYMLSVPDVQPIFQGMLDAGIAFPKWQKWHAAYFKYGYLLVITTEEYKNEIVFKRFAKVFEQAYTRFLDLQKAEAQTREAQIEAALEKVRSRSLAMHKSDEMLFVMEELIQKVRELNIDFDGAIIVEFKEDDSFDLWSGHEVSAIDLMTFPSYNKRIKPFNDLFIARNSKQKLFTNRYSTEEKNELFNYLFEENFYNEFPEERKQFIFQQECFTVSIAFAKNTAVQLYSYTRDAFSESENDILQRFSKVFEQSYTRFLDLQRAEAQAREAKLESALEKVRNVALGLQRSEDMLEIAQVLYEQLRELGFDDMRNTLIDIDNGGDGTFTDYDYSEEMSGTVTQMAYTDDPTLEEQFRKMISKTDDLFEILLTGKRLQDLINMRRANGEAEDPRLLRVDQVSYNMFSFGNGSIGISNFGPLDDAHKEVLARFRNVFTFAYKRYSDLAQAEAQAREARIEMALEKVRSRTLAMQKSDELAETSVVVFQQLINLGIAPNRLFIGVFNKENKTIEAWATNEDGTKIGNHFTLNADSNESVNKMYQGWKQKKSSISIDMEGTELQNYFHYLSDEMHIPFKGGLSQKRRVQTIAYFGQGLIGMASPEEQPEATTQLLERFAAVFNLTYTRFNDLKIAEAQAIRAEEDLVKLQIAKREAENALTELKSTQSQLIQAEKMASLGELTAGIAHEIQNPLNFVNNFAEISKELLAEMLEELNNGDAEEAHSIADDVIQNLEKINHHGKRADAIVKGMLQHSRMNTGSKEPTDINALADEYLRLAYHGLRAKDKSFNSDFKTNFDESLEKINVIPQDIGRVILNLFNNGFYAVQEKAREGKSGFHPLVSVFTKKEGNHIEIHVSDNGNGIPHKILDKIYQPFFTTKPTGQGTGLGLSLSYDIIKAHGGELKVETEATKGTIFTIVLPINHS